MGLFDTLAVLKTDPIDTARRTWTWLLGSVPISPRLAVDDLSTTAGDPDIDKAAAELRQALLTLAQAEAWPPTPEALDVAVGRLVSASVLVRDEDGEVLPRGPFFDQP